MTWRARWFDGQRSTPHTVHVSLDGPLLRIHADEPGAPALAEVSAALLSPGERFQGAPRMIGLPGGGTLQVEEDAAGGFDGALRQAGHRPGPVYRLIERWRHVLACAVLLIGVVIWIDRQGIGLMADAAVRVTPVSVDARIGAPALPLLDRQWLAPSRLPEARQLAIEARFTRLVHEQYPDLRCRLVFRTTGSGADAFNAFALPGGTIVLLDGLAEAMTDEEVLAVLGHELGHVVHRDSMHGLAQQLGLQAVASILWGDVSSLAASLTAGFQGLRYSRAMEASADAFAVDFLACGGMPPQRLADAFTVIQRKEAAMGSVPAFLNNHPATDERLAAAQAAAGQGCSRAPAPGSGDSAIPR